MTSAAEQVRRPERSTDDDTTTPVIEARDLHVHFTAKGQRGPSSEIHALDGVNFALAPGEICALVGESGSGKTTIARVFSLIYQATSGEVLVQGKPLRVRGGRAERDYYRHVQLVYQDPFASLNGLKKIRSILSRVVKIHFPKLSRSEVTARVKELLETVNMSPPERYLDRYPTDLSGGQRQRIAIARALAVGPKVLLADEPTSMLDASIRLEVLNLLKDLRDREGLAILYITHDIASARYLSDRINVMYGGRIVESGPTESVVSDPVHPYTRLLLGAAPDPDRYKGSGAPTHEQVTDAQPVDNSGTVIGCRFAPRCPLVMDQCTLKPLPTYRSQGDARLVRCWTAEDRPDLSR